MYADLFLLFVACLVLVAMSEANSPSGSSLTRMCSSIDRKTRCDASSELSPSWCEHRNPLIVPRFMDISSKNNDNSVYTCDGAAWDSKCTMVHGFPVGISKNSLSMMSPRRGNLKGLNRFTLMEMRKRKFKWSRCHMKYLEVLDDSDKNRQTVAFAGQTSDSAVPLVIDILSLQAQNETKTLKTSWIIN